jgi:hypothetical protein
MADEVVSRLNGALGEELVRQAHFRPGGWDPCGGAGAPPPLAKAPEGGEGSDQSLGNESTAEAAGGRRHHRRAPARRLTDKEKAALEEISEVACDEELGRLIAAAMRAALRQSPSSSG